MFVEFCLLKIGLLKINTILFTLTNNTLFYLKKYITEYK